MLWEGERKDFPLLSSTVAHGIQFKMRTHRAYFLPPRAHSLQLNRIKVRSIPLTARHPPSAWKLHGKLHEGRFPEPLYLGKLYSSFLSFPAMPRNQLRRKKFDRWPKLCSCCAVAWRLKATFAFTIHFPMTKTGSTWIRCVAPAAAVDPRAVRGRSPPPGGATRLGLWIGVRAHRLPLAVQA